MIDEKKPKTMKKHNPECYQLQRDIVIPKGTVLRQAADERGGQSYVECVVGHGKDFASHFVVQKCLDAETSGDFKKVIT